jgi:hypothetical protein
VTCDNFFTSLHLAEKLWEEKITLVGTVNANKKQFIPQNFIKSKTREVLSTSFLFQDFLTIASYVPKKNKSVILLSTHHHEPDIDYDLVANKPEMINFYNRNKWPVDAYDQKAEDKSCRRKTHRWTVNVFYFLVDCAAQNAASLSLFQRENESIIVRDRLRFRQNELEILANSLLSPNALDRYKKFAQNNLKNVHKTTLDEIKKLIPNVM